MLYNYFGRSGKIAFSAVLVALALWLHLLDALPRANWVALLVLNAALFALQSDKIAGSSHWLSRLGLWFTCLALGFFIALYRPGNFNYPLIYHFASLDFPLYANLGKGLAGASILLWLWPTTGQHKPLGTSLALALLAVPLVIFTAHGLGIAWQVKFPAGIVWFLLINLGITVLAEEAFFRLLIQDQLANIWGKSTMAAGLAAIVSVILFTLAHTYPTQPYFALYLLAGSLYCAVYTYSRRLTMTLATHALVNLGHFTLLTYPLN